MSGGPDLDKRVLIQTAFGASLVLLTGRGEALTGALGREGVDWLGPVEELTAALRGETLTVAEWRSGLDQLFARIELNELLGAINFDQLRDRAGYADKGVATAEVSREGRQLSFYPKLFAVGQGRAIIPHGHAGMVSSHLVLDGRMRLRQYDQVDRSDETLTVRPTIDRMVEAGDLSSIGTEADNVHWFTAEAPSHTLDVIVTNLDDEGRAFDIFNLDMNEAAPIGDGLYSVPRLDVPTALAKYG